LNPAPDVPHTPDTKKFNILVRPFSLMPKKQCVSLLHAETLSVSSLRKKNERERGALVEFSLLLSTQTPLARLNMIQLNEENNNKCFSELEPIDRNLELCSSLVLAQ
jgi:hypothetical protein